MHEKKEFFKTTIKGLKSPLLTPISVMESTIYWYVYKLIKITKGNYSRSNIILTLYQVWFGVRVLTSQKLCSKMIH